jgi:hypothetical protein
VSPNVLPLEQEICSIKYRFDLISFFRVKAGPSQQGVPQLYPLQTIEEVLRNAESRWMELKDKLVKKIELEKYRVTNHIYEENINASGVPAINNSPSFILHSLPDISDFDNNGHDGYLHKEMLSALLDKVMSSSWLFLMGTSG